MNTNQHRINVPGMVELNRCPEYFVNIKDNRLYSIKSGTMKPLKLSRIWRYQCGRIRPTNEYGYRISNKGKRLTVPVAACKEVVLEYTKLCATQKAVSDNLVKAKPLVNVNVQLVDHEIVSDVLYTNVNISVPIKQKRTKIHEAVLKGVSIQHQLEIVKDIEKWIHTEYRNNTRDSFAFETEVVAGPNGLFEFYEVTSEDTDGIVTSIINKIKELQI